MKKESVLDTIKINELKSLSSGGVEFFKEIVVLYLDNTRMEINKLKEAISGSDYEYCAKIAHSLKSSSGSLGAIALAGLFSQLEEKAREKEIEEVVQICNQIEPAYEIIKEELEALIS